MAIKCCFGKYLKGVFDRKTSARVITGAMSGTFFSITTLFAEFTS